MANHISSALDEAYKKLASLMADRAKIDKKIINWKRVIDSLMAVSECGNQVEDDPSDVEISTLTTPSGKTKIKFTDGVRMVLRQNAHREIPLTPPEIRGQLTNLGFNFAKYAQPLVPIHNTLKRLEEQGEVQSLKNELGQALGYKWIDPVQRAIYQTSAWEARMDTVLSPARLPEDHPLQKLKMKAKTPGEQIRDLRAIRERYSKKK